MMDFPDRLVPAARIALWTGTGGLAVVGLLDRTAPALPLPTLAPDSILKLALCATFLLGAVALLRSRRAESTLPLFWGASLIATLADAGASLAAWVPVAEALALLAVSLHLTLHRPGTGFTMAACGVMFALFGVVHWTEAASLTAIVPAWLPPSPHWPRLTGTILLAAAAAMLVPRLCQWAVLAVAALFASWLLIVHAGRIAADPTSAFEWQFALMALCLTAALLIAAHPHHRSPTWMPRRPQS
jgi:uncharacterized membrane protein